MLIDSHCHLNRLDLTEFGYSLDHVLAQALAHGVDRMLCVSVELSDWPILRDLAERYSQVNVSAGVHPDSDELDVFDANRLLQYASDKYCVALGETGLDFYRATDASEQLNQKQRFQSHIEIARKVKKPIIIHTRQASAETLDIMQAEQARDVGGVMHCFTESWTVAKCAMDMGFYISLSGIVSFKNAATLHDVAKKIPLDRLLIETDAPYLAPVPFRGKQNHPALVKHVAEALCELRGETFDVLAKATTDNFYRCFSSVVR